MHFPSHMCRQRRNADSLPLSAMICSDVQKAFIKREIACVPISPCDQLAHYPARSIPSAKLRCWKQNCASWVVRRNTDFASHPYTSVIPCCRSERSTGAVGPAPISRRTGSRADCAATDAATDCCASQGRQPPGRGRGHSFPQQCYTFRVRSAWLKYRNQVDLSSAADNNYIHLHAQL